jgi:hypothetical protein
MASIEPCDALETRGAEEDEVTEEGTVVVGADVGRDPTLADEEEAAFGKFFERIVRPPEAAAASPSSRF